jgi:ERCC4-type nuclease
MYIQAQKDLNNKPIVKKFPKKHKNPAYNYLAYCIYGVSAKRASEIVYTCHLKTMEDLFNLTHQDLTRIDGIGENLADRILNSISEDSYES